MKKCLLLLLLLVLAACGAKETPDAHTADDENIVEQTPVPSPDPTPEPAFEPTSQPTTEPDPTPTPEPHISSIPLEGISSHFARLDALLDADGGALWGEPLHVPLMFYDAETRHIVANRQDPQGILVPQEGVYVGVLPQGVLINEYGVRFAGLQWARMYWWEGFNPTPEGESEDPMWSMLYRVIDAWKPHLFGERQGTQRYGHLDNEEQRVFLRMEMNALLAAMQDAREESRMETIRAALSIRAHRRAMLTPHAITNENDLHIDEGIYAYTTMKLQGISIDETIENAARNIKPNDEYDQSLQWTSAYSMGILYLLLLDAMDADWRHNITFATDLGDLLAYHTGIDEFIPIDALDVERFGYSAISATEHGWLAFREGLDESARELFAGERPILWMRGDGPIETTRSLWLDVAGLGKTRRGSVSYMTLTYEGEFGILRGENILLMLDWFDVGHRTYSYAISAVDMRIEGNRVTGHGWEIELNEGFVVMEVEPGHFWVRRA